MSDIERRLYYEQIADVLRQEIRENFVAGDRLPGDRVHAERFGVSVVTVRQAMQQLCREGLIHRRHGSGTYVNEQAAQDQVAILVCGDILRGAASFFWQQLAREIQRLLGELNVLTTIELDPDQTPERLLRLNGVVAIRAGVLGDWPHNLDQHGIPVISNDRRFPVHVTWDVPTMVRQAVRHLAEQGCSRLAILTHNEGSRELDTNQFVNEFRPALAAHELEFHPELAILMDAAAPPRNEREWDAFRGLWEGDVEPPDGLFVADDTLFQQAALSLMALDVNVPEQLRVIAHANKGADILCPFPVARLECDPVEFAQAMVDLLCRHMTGESPSAEERVVLQVPLVVPDAMG
jgi:DNA-binding LacI/PurR family transcriptional regulator